MQLDTVAICGSVDDGKSTFVGRLLHDTKNLKHDSLIDITTDKNTDFSLITDGLSQERELKITIDVSFKHVFYKDLEFLLADCPGHIEYTQNTIAEASKAKLNLSINTNMCVPSNLIDRFIEKLNKVKHNVKTLTVFTSIEGNGPEQEYVRDGMDTKVFWQNIEKLLSLTEVSVTYMTTINVFSAQTLPEFIGIALEQRRRFKQRINISFNYLRHPSFLALPTLSLKCRQKVFAVWQVYINSSTLYSNELESLNRIISWALSQPESHPNKEDLIAFVDQLEVRRGLSKTRAQWVLDNL